MRLSKREKILLILVLLIGSAVAYYLLFLQPCLDEINKLNSQIISDQNLISTNKLLKKNIETVEQGIIDDENKMAEFGDSIKSAFDQPAVLVYLYETMNNYGKKVQINFSDSGALGQIKLCKVYVSMVGTYDALKSVMEEFAGNEYFIKVTSLTAAIPNLSSGDSDSGSEGSAEPGKFVMPPGFLNIGMDIEFYYIGDEIPPDKIYDFTGGAVQYGGNMFG